jgi:hypothetical protein
VAALFVYLDDLEYYNIEDYELDPTDEEDGFLANPCKSTVLTVIAALPIVVK